MMMQYLLAACLLRRKRDPGVYRCRSHVTIQWRGQTLEITNRGLVGLLILAAAHLIGVEHIYQLGGAQAIAALAFGTESVPQVDKIVGAGNLIPTPVLLPSTHARAPCSGISSRCNRSRVEVAKS